LTVITCLLLAGAACAAPYLTFDPAGNLYQYWLTSSREVATIMISRSIDQGLNFAPPVPLYHCTGEITSCSLQIGGGQRYFLSYGTSRESWFTRSNDNGRAFSAPLPLTGEAAFSAALALDAGGEPRFLFLTRDTRQGTTQLRFSAGISHEPSVITRSADELAAPRLFTSPWGLIAVWDQRYLDRQNTFYAVSLDNGRHFSQPKPLPPGPAIAYLAYRGEKWVAYSLGQKLTANDLVLPRPTYPARLAPADGALIRAATVEVSYHRAADDPVITRLEFSSHADFAADRTWTFERLDLPGSADAAFPVPVDLPDGRYFYRFSAFDGLSLSFPSPVSSLTLDRQPPQISLLTPTGETSGAIKITVSGRLSEKADLTLNGRTVTAETDGRFCWPLTLAPGANNFTIVATDEAGNTAKLSRLVTYSTLKPVVTVIKPQPDDWFKPDSSILFAVTAADQQDDIADETEAEVVIAGRALADRLVYSKADGSLSGFVKLPADLPDGRLTAAIRLRDSAGNLAEESFQINIDRLAPTLAVVSGEAFFSRSASLITLLVSDTGAGLDPAGTIISLRSITFEAVATGEALLLKLPRPLPAGSYEVTVIPRDRIGNTGAPVTCRLVIDETPPLFAVTGTAESAGRCRLEGTVADDYPDRVVVYNNGLLFDGFSLSGQTFCRGLNLPAGSNELRIEAFDRAGNSASQSLSFFSHAVSQSAVVNKIGNGPNPFAAGTEQTYIIYTLSGTADLAFYIFDLSGGLIWQKNLSGVGSGSLAWNGTDHFGRVVPRGVYPYTVRAVAGGVSELHRGKIIVY
jgi:hypothetical protein